MGNKIVIIAEILEKLEDPENRGVISGTWTIGVLTPEVLRLAD